MPRANLTSIVVILDKSTSMSIVQRETIEGFNSFLDAQKKEPGDARLTMIQFNTRYDIKYVEVPVRDVQPLNTHTYNPSGMTALFDAVGRGIDELGQKLSNTPEHDRPEKVIFVIITDGEENSSIEYVKVPGKVASMIKHQEDVYKWKFIYLGAGPNALTQAVQLGVNMDMAAAYKVSNQTQLYSVLSASVTRGRSGQNMNYTKGERHSLMADDPADNSFGNSSNSFGNSSVSLVDQTSKG